MATETKDQIKATIEQAIQPCMDAVDAGEYSSKNEAIDALIADLQAAKEQPGMKGLGDEGKMELPGPEENPEAPGETEQ